MSSTRRDTSRLALGSVVSGLLAYAVFALVTHGLGAATAAPVAVLWTHWAFAGAAFTFPLQHWITRCVASGQEGEVRRAARRITAVVLLASVLLGSLAWLARDQLFGRPGAAFPVMIGLVTVGSALVGAARGVLGGRERFGAVAASLVAENGLRCLLVVVLLVAGVEDPVAYGLCLVAGPLVVACWPASLRLARDRPAGPVTTSAPLVFLSGAASSQLVGQVVLTGGPVVIALLGGSPAQVTSVFAALALFRAPYMVVLAAVPQLTVRFAQDRSRRQRAAAGRVAAVAAATALLVAVAAVMGGTLGPPLLDLVFGPTVDVAPGTAALLAAGCGLALVNLVLTVSCLAVDRPLAAAGAWGAAVLTGGAAVVVLGSETALDRAVAAFVVAEVAALLGLALVAGRGERA